MNHSYARPIAIGGKIEPDKANSSAIAARYESIAIVALNAESRCEAAHQALLDRTSKDSDFMSDEEMRDKLAFIRETLAECEKALVKRLHVHHAHRGIHQTRVFTEKRKQQLAEAEAKYL